MRYRVRHRTTYDYEAAVVSSQHLTHLEPRGLPHQDCISFYLDCPQCSGSVTAREDYFGNRVHAFEILEEHQTLTVTTEAEVELRPRDPQALPVGFAGSWEECRTVLGQSGTPLDVEELRQDSPLIRRQFALVELARAAFTPGRDLLEATIAFNEWLHGEFRFDPTATEVSTPLAEVLKRRAGVCQDFAHIAVGCLRSLGLAARYVSGYLETIPPAGTARLVGADASHAWASVYIPSIGWLDFDPTNALLPSDRHVTVAWGRDFSDVTPIKGVLLGGGAHTVTVGVDVVPLGESGNGQGGSQTQGGTQAHGGTQSQYF